MKKLFENFKKRDLIVILISIAALVLLFFAIRMTKHQEEADQEALIESGAEGSNSDTAEAVIDESTFVINEVSSNGQIELYNDSTKEIDISGNTNINVEPLCKNNNLTKVIISQDMIEFAEELYSSGKIVEIYR